MVAKKSSDAVRAALLDLGFDLPELNFVERDSISVGEPVRIHEIDRTPVIVDPGLGAGGSQEQCLNSIGIDVGGKAVTGGDGKFVWRLSNFICEGDLAVSEPVSFVATARSDSPVLMTSKTVSTGDDLVIDVFSWDVNGTPSPKVAFAWRCWLHAPSVVD